LIGSIYGNGDFFSLIGKNEKNQVKLVYYNLYRFAHKVFKLELEEIEKKLAIEFEPKWSNSDFKIATESETNSYKRKLSLNPFFELQLK
jgi:hypothetical protein